MLGLRCFLCWPQSEKVVKHSYILKLAYATHHSILCGHFNGQILNKKNTKKQKTVNMVKAMLQLEFLNMTVLWYIWKTLCAKLTLSISVFREHWGISPQNVLLKWNWMEVVILASFTIILSIVCVYGSLIKFKSPHRKYVVV